MHQIVGAPADADATTFWHAIEKAVKDVLPGRASEVAPFIGALLGAAVPQELRARFEYLEPGRLRGEAFRAIGGLLTAMAMQTPLIVVFEDLHWADSASIDLATDLLGLTADAPIGLVLVFRPRPQRTVVGSPRGRGSPTTGTSTRRSNCSHWNSTTHARSSRRC